MHIAYEYIYTYSIYNIISVLLKLSSIRLQFNSVQVYSIPFFLDYSILHIISPSSEGGGGD